MSETHAQLNFEVLPQPDDTTCGPTCLHSVYRYFNHPVSLEEVISEIAHLPEGGTLAVTLACHALSRGFRATIYTYNLQLFDPTWFVDGALSTKLDIPARLKEQKKLKRGQKFALATDAYVEFLNMGGILRYEELNGSLLRKHLNRNLPILTGLSSTHLYNCARERDDEYDDVGGKPQGHFVVLSGYDREQREVQVADPLLDNPRYDGQYYRVHMDRLIASILLGILTYDANLLVIEPRTKR